MFLILSEFLDDKVNIEIVWDLYLLEIRLGVKFLYCILVRLLLVSERVILFEKIERYKI